MYFEDKTLAHFLQVDKLSRTGNRDINNLSGPAIAVDNWMLVDFLSTGLCRPSWNVADFLQPAHL
jgi:hypothetical protein